MRRSIGRELAAAVIVTVSLTSGGCHQSGTSNIERPTPVTPGSPVAGVAPVTASIGPNGGTIATPDGLLTVNVPAGAVSSLTQFSIQEISNNAPHGIGSAYRLGAGGVSFKTPVAITFRTGQISTPTESLAVVFQNDAGYWVHVLSSLRNKTAKLITASSLHFSDWTLVPSDPTLDMAGQFTITSTLDAPAQFTAVGTAGMAYAGEDSVERVYLFTGTTTLQPLTVSGAACTMPSTPYTFPTNVAEVFKSPANFEFGTSAIWDLSCGTTPTHLEMVFDTAGISHIGCSRGYTMGVPGPVATQDTLTGDYTIDCTAQGRGAIRGSWAFQRCGGPCTSTDTCATSAVYSCASGTPVCTVTQTAPAGTACTPSGGGSGVCDPNGTCNACTAGASCTSTTACGATATLVCSSGIPVCTDQTYKAAGTVCTDASGNAGVCSGTSSGCVQCAQGATCTPSGPCASSASIACSSGSPVCTDGSPKAVGTPCTDSGGNAGVCNGTSASCVQCTQGASCTPSNPCIASATIDCSTGQPVCVDGPGIPAGQACTGVAGAVCSGPTGSPPNTCNLCAPGPCTSSGPCAPTASINCTTGFPICQDGPLSSAGVGCTTSTGAAGVCNGTSSSCVACTQGASCTSTDVCIASATLDCSSGVPVCTDTTGQSAGTACTTSSGAAGVCSGSPANSCTACTAGTACTSTNVCVATASVVCSSGAPVCTDTAFQPDATVCDSTTNSVCVSGACALCAAGTSCVPSNPCHMGSLSCGDPTTIPPTPPSCVDTGVSVADGAACNTVANGACLAGACTACVAGTSCTPTNACDAGTLSCANPTATPPTTSSCTDTLTPVVTCPTGQTCNPATGICG